MSIFSTILHKIFPSSHPAVTASTQNTPAATTGAAPAGTSTSTSASAANAAPVDVEAVLSAMAANNPQKLNWRESIVDLMKLLSLDSGLGARKELAHELGYTGDTNDSASMNIWLHKQVMKKLAENGGKVPADLKS